jgi:subtilisin family serine protease
MNILRILLIFTRNSFLLFALLLALSASIPSSSNAASRQALNDQSSNPSLEYAADSILVKFRTNATPAKKMNARALVSGEKIRSYSLVDGLEHMQLGKGQGVERAIEILQLLPFVEYAEPDYLLHANTNDALFDLQWSLHNTGHRIRNFPGNFDADIDAPEAWAITTGNPAFVIAVIDTGVEYTHEDLANNAWRNPGEIPGNGIDDDGNGYIDDIYGWDFYNNDNNPMDEEGHGTHVAGTICAEGNNGTGVSGVAWRCNIMALRFLGPDGGWTSDAIEALNYAVDRGVRVSNNSWGGGGYSSSLYNAIKNAGTSAGHLFIAAAGNGGMDGVGDNTDITPHYPSSYDLDNIISVAATDNRDRLAGFSNYGTTSVDLGAPGVDIASTMLSQYYWSNGTSMATPHVTGVAALIFGLYPQFTNTQVRDLILNTTRPIDALNGKTLTGGVVNAYDALLAGGALSGGECGDGIVDAGEDCDAGIANGTTTCGCQSNCTYSSSETPCEDGEFCNGNETCNGAGACQAGAAVDCNDDVGCTDDSCDEVNDSCINAANDANCPDDGQFCTGVEYCDTVTDCDSTGNPCVAGESCNDVIDTCDVLACSDISDKGTCNADPTCEWTGNPRNGWCRDITIAEMCAGGIDEDGDGLIDCEDPDCAGVGSCPALPCSSLDRGACQDNPSCEWVGNPKNGECQDVGGGTEPTITCSDYDGDQNACGAAGCRWNKNKMTCN